MTRVYLALGSNVGDRSLKLRAALGELKRIRGTRLLRVSRVFESSPVGFLRQRPFLNCCAEIRTALSPMGLLIELKRVEAVLGRRPARRWGPRPIDIDILLFGSRRVRSRLLTIPHPRMHQRRFVLAPLAELYSPAHSRLRRLNAPSQNVKLLL